LHMVQLMPLPSKNPVMSLARENRTIINQDYYERYDLLTQTICRSTNSERPHRCCHLANNSNTRLIFHILHYMQGDAHSKIALFLGYPDPSPSTWFLGPTSVHITNRISICLSVLAQFTLVSNRRTDGATSLTIGRIYMKFATYMRCGLKLTCTENPMAKFAVCEHKTCEPSNRQTDGPGP